MDRHSTQNSVPQVFVARQPILDRTRRVIGYELLYRHSGNAEDAGDARTNQTTADHATAHLICDGLLAIGLDTLTDGRRAFINVSRRLLLDGIPAVLPPARVVFELGADVEADSEVIEACQALRAAGYSLAIDDFAMTDWIADLIPMASYLKVDFLAQASGERARVTAADLPGGPALIGKRIETLAQFDEALNDGYSYFQGFFFGRPVVREGRGVPAQPLAQMRLMRALHDPNLSVHQLENLVKHDPSLCYRILRTVNSAGFALQTTVSSIREALVLLGRDAIRRWASLWMLAGLSEHAHSELLAMAAIRARCCESLGASLNDDEAAADGFLVGMCSLLDAILERPMEALLEELPLPPLVRAALVGEDNSRRRILECTTAYASGQFALAMQHAQRAGIDPVVLPKAYADALRWARELSQAKAA
jgi:EAL and modified HD-GYP domain-containing signal transduction protein